MKPNQSTFTRLKRRTPPVLHVHMWNKLFCSARGSRIKWCHASPNTTSCLHVVGESGNVARVQSIRIMNSWGAACEITAYSIQSVSEHIMTLINKHIKANANTLPYFSFAKWIWVLKILQIYFPWNRSLVSTAAWTNLISTGSYMAWWSNPTRNGQYDERGWHDTKRPAARLQSESDHDLYDQCCRAIYMWT